MAKTKITICMGSSCFARGNEKNLELIENFLCTHCLNDEINLKLTGTLCHGKCNIGPNVSINGRTYNKVTEGVMLDLLKKVFNKA
jgi:NADH:ubiquinone oxidoreductase subunit E